MIISIDSRMLLEYLSTNRIIIQWSRVVSTEFKLLYANWYFPQIYFSPSFMEQVSIIKTCIIYASLTPRETTLSNRKSREITLRNRLKSREITLNHK